MIAMKTFLILATLRTVFSFQVSVLDKALSINDHKVCLSQSFEPRFCREVCSSWVKMSNNDENPSKRFQSSSRGRGGSDESRKDHTRGSSDPSAPRQYRWAPKGEQGEGRDSSAGSYRPSRGAPSGGRSRPRGSSIHIDVEPQYLHSDLHGFLLGGSTSPVDRKSVV